MVVFASLNRPLTSTTTSSPASDFPPGSQGSKGTLIRVPSCRLLHARSVAAPRPRLRLPLFELPRDGASYSRPFSGGSVSGSIARQLRPRASVAAARALGCPLAAGSLLRDWPRLAVAFRACALSCGMPRAHASGLAAVSLSAPLAGSMLAVPSTKAGAVSTAGMAPPRSFASAPRAFDFPASVSTPVHTDPFVAFVCPVDLLCRSHVGIIAVGNLGRWLWYD